MVTILLASWNQDFLTCILCLNGKTVAGTDPKFSHDIENYCYGENGPIVSFPPFSFSPVCKDEYCIQKIIIMSAIGIVMLAFAAICNSLEHSSLIFTFSCTSLTPGPSCDRFKLHIPYAGETLKCKFRTIVIASWPFFQQCFLYHIKFLTVSNFTNFKIPVFCFCGAEALKTINYFWDQFTAFRNRLTDLKTRILKAMVLIKHYDQDNLMILVSFVHALCFGFSDLVFCLYLSFSWRICICWLICPLSNSSVFWFKVLV